MTCNSHECHQGRKECPHHCTELEQRNSDGSSPDDSLEYASVFFAIIWIVCLGVVLIVTTGAWK